MGHQLVSVKTVPMGFCGFTCNESAKAFLHSVSVKMPQ